MKQPRTEGNEPARIIIDNTIHGNIDVVDLNAAGTDPARLQRYSYREPVECADDPYCSWSLNEGNSLAIEPLHETLRVNDLNESDILYIADDNDNPFHIKSIRIGHPLADLNPSPLTDIDFSSVFPCSIGVRGLSMAGPRDILYMPSGCQSFEQGSIAEFDTTTNQLNKVILLTYRDQDFVHVDWHDTRRVFVATSDFLCSGGSAYDPTCGLYLHLIYDGTLIDSLLLMTDFEARSLQDMVFDPYNRLLYLTVGPSVMVVKVNYGADPAPVAPIVGSQVITPGEGGDLVVSDQSAELYFPAGAVDDPVVVTYQETDPSIYFQSNRPTAPSMDNTLYTVRTFEISAVISGTTTPVTSFNSQYHMDINYTDREMGSAIENSLALYWWTGTEWQLDVSSNVWVSINTVSTYLTYTGLFAIMGETKQVFLPIVFRR